MALFKKKSDDQKGLKFYIVLAYFPDFIGE